MQDMMPSAMPTAMGGDGSSSKLSRVCDAIIRWTTYALVFLMPLFFLPWTMEVSELNKQLLLIAGAAIAGIAWLGKMLVERRFEYRRSVVNVFVVLSLAAYALSAWTSQSRYMSMVGDFGQEMAGLVTMLAFVIMYFVVINNFRDLKSLNRLLLATVVGGFVSAVYALLQGIGVHILPFDFSKTSSFNTVGTVAALGVYLSYIVTLCGGMLLAGHNATGTGKKGMALKIFLALTAVVSLFLIAVVDFWPVTLPLMLSSALLIAFAFVHAKSVKGIGGVLLPIATLVISVLLLLFRFPVTLGYPAEVMPSFKASAEITLKTLREHPFLGSGPGTFIFDYAKFRAAEVNQSQFWNIRFDRSASHILTSLATTGLIGTLTWFLVAIFLLFSAGKKLLRTEEETWHLLIGVFAAWLMLLVARFTYSSTISLEFAFWITMAALVVTHRREFLSVKFEQSPRAAMFVSFLFILGLVFSLSGLFVEGQRYAAEVAYAKAIQTDRAGGSTDDVVKGLSRAVDLNGQNDVYLRNLALAYLVKADKTLSDTPKVDQKKDEKKEDYDARVQQARQDQIKEVSQFTAAAVNTAKAATDLDGKNVADWSVLASIYQSLMGVTDGADDWAVKSYLSSIDLEPGNPALHTELGKVYVYQSDAAAQLAQTTKDDKTKADSQKSSKDLLDKAVDEFNKSISLKSDYAPAHYNLALALDRQGKLKEAIVKMESVVNYNPQDVGVGFQLALLYFRDGRKDDAIHLLEQVVKLQPNYSNARWYLAAMYEDKGDFDDAIAQIQKVLALNPDNDLVKQKLDDLNKKKAMPPGQLPPPVDQPVTNQNQPGVTPPPAPAPAPAPKKK